MTDPVANKIPVEPDIPTALSKQWVPAGDLIGSAPPGSIRLSELFRCPSALQMFPAAAQLIDDARSWMLQYVEPLGGGPRLLRPVDETVSMCCYLFPEGSYEGVLLSTIFLAIEFVSDDIFDSREIYDLFRASAHTKHSAEALRALRETPELLLHAMLAIVDILRDPTTAPVILPNGISTDLFLHDAFRACATRLHRFGHRTQSPHFLWWLERFCAAIIGFSKSHLNIYKDIAHLTVAEYITHKLVNCGMLHTVLLIELANGYFLSPAEYDLPLVRELGQHCIHVGSLLNEITSYEKEVFQEHSGNLLLVVMLKQGVDLRGATQHVAALAQEHADAVARLGKRARAELTGSDAKTQALRRYVRSIELLTAACWHWQIAGTTRYQSSTSPFVELLTEH